MQTADQLLNLLADQAVETDEIAEGAQAKWTADAIALMSDPEGRDLALWTIAYAELLEPLGVISLEDFLTGTNLEYALQPQSPVRNLVWQAMVAAAIDQANGPAVRETLKTASGQAEQIAADAKGVSRATLEEAAQEGIGNARFKAAKDRRNG